MPCRGLALVSFVALVVLGCGGAEKESTTATTTPTSIPAAPPAAAADEAGTQVVATYGDKRITRAQIMQEFERMPAPSRAYVSSPDRKRQFVENLILNDLIFDEGAKQGYDKDPDVDKQVSELRKRLVVQKVMRKYQTPPEITDEQAKAYYDANRQLYSGTQVHASHILVKDEDTAKQIATEVKAHPEKFAEIAKAKSVDTATAQRGGDLGTFAQGRMVPEFEKAAFSLQPGTISDPVKTQYGWHVIMVTERKEGEPKPFDQVKEQIKAMLRNKALQDQVQTHFEQLKRDAKVNIDDEALSKIVPPTAGPVPSMPIPAMGGH